MFNTLNDYNSGKLHYQQMLRDADNDRLARKMKGARLFSTAASVQRPARRVAQLLTALLR